MVLNPTNYLTSQGWEGPGKGLTSTSRVKPITVLQKKNTLGVGKERDTAYPWWDDVFSHVLNKIGQPRINAEQTKPIDDVELARTTTGIISPLPPPGPAIDSSTSSTPNLNLDAMGQAKRNAAHRDLYRRFRRGRPIEGTVDEKSLSDQATSSIAQIKSDISTTISSQPLHSHLIESKLTEPVASASTDCIIETGTRDQKQDRRKEKKSSRSGRDDRVGSPQSSRDCDRSSSKKKRRGKGEDDALHQPDLRQDHASITIQVDSLEKVQAKKKSSKHEPSRKKHKKSNKD